MSHQQRKRTCIYVVVFEDKSWSFAGWLGDDDGRIDVLHEMGGAPVASYGADDLPPEATVCCSLSAAHTLLPWAQQLRNAAFVERFGFQVCFLDVKPGDDVREKLAYIKKASYVELKGAARE